MYTFETDNVVEFREMICYCVRNGVHFQSYEGLAKSNFDYIIEFTGGY